MKRHRFSLSEGGAIPDFPPNRLAFRSVLHGEIEIGPSGRLPWKRRWFNHRMRLVHDGGGVGSPQRCERKGCDFVQDGIEWPDD